MLVLLGELLRRAVQLESDCYQTSVGMQSSASSIRKGCWSGLRCRGYCKALAQKVARVAGCTYPKGFHDRVAVAESQSAEVLEDGALIASVEYGLEVHLFSACLKLLAG